MADVAAKAYFVLNSDAKLSTKGPGNNVHQEGSAKTTTSKYGGRVDIRKTVNDIAFTLSATDASVRDYENAPYVRDVIISADKKINANTAVGAGYDFGSESLFASVAGDTDVSSKTVSGRAIWFQKNNAVRLEGSLRLDSRSTFSAAYTLNDTTDNANATYVNLVERNGFIIDPFRVQVANASAKYSLTTNGVTAEAAVDINTRRPYLSVAKAFTDADVKLSYAVQEETALLEVIPTRQLFERRQPFKVFAKSRLGANGVGPVSVGLIFDDIIEL